MFLRKKKGQPQRASQEKSLYPVLYIADSLKKYQQELVKKEVVSLWELSQIGASFGGVLKEGDRFQTKLQDLGASFSNINETAERRGKSRQIWAMV